MGDLMTFAIANRYHYATLKAHVTTKRFSASQPSSDNNCITKLNQLYHEVMRFRCVI